MRFPGVDTLNRIQSIAVTLSSLAVPIVLGVIGWSVQDKIASEGLKKDYVQIAINVLNEKKDGQDPELRRWAVRMIDTNSPIPLPPSLKEKLRDGSATVPSPLSDQVLEELRRRGYKGVPVLPPVAPAPMPQAKP